MILKVIDVLLHLSGAFCTQMSFVLFMVPLGATTPHIQDAM